MAERTNFGKLHKVLDLPDLIETQTKSYIDFLQMEVDPTKRKNVGLQSVFKEVFPIESYDGQCTLDFVRYEISEPKLNPLHLCTSNPSPKAKTQNPTRDTLHPEPLRLSTTSRHV